MNNNISGNLIDLGCGGGQFLKKLKEKGLGFNLTAVDFSQEALIRTAERNIENLQIVRCNLKKLTKYFKKDSFDIATSIGTHEHIYDYITAFRQVYFILKKKGIFILALPKRESLKGDWYYNFEDQSYWCKAREKWIRDIESCGFRYISEDFEIKHWIFILEKV